MQSLGVTKLTPAGVPAARPGAPHPRPLTGAKPAAPLVPGFIASKTVHTLLRLPHAASFPSFPNSEGGHAFVRPDLPPPESDDEARAAAAAAAPFSRWPRQQPAANNIVDKGPLLGSSGTSERVHFRSALEQVSYQTSKAAMGSADDARPAKKAGLFGRRK